MNKNKLRSAVTGLTILFAFAFFVACNNNETESSNYSDSSASAMMPADSTYVNIPVDTNALTKTGPVTDTSVTNTPTAEAKPAKPSNNTSATKKKVKASVTMATVAKTSTPKMGIGGVYEMTQVRPSYPGGQPAAEEYVNDHIQYPQSALDYNKEGTVQVEFIVDERGNISDAHEVGNKLGEGLDEEAVRVVASMPAWKPGMVSGKPVKSKVTLPISFKIEE